MKSEQQSDDIIHTSCTPAVREKVSWAVGDTANGRHGVGTFSVQLGRKMYAPEA